jgi:predicted GIY-YIG superfamily endonuclease
MGVYVYMLRCADSSFYVGSATGDDLSPRIDQHNAGFYPGYTFTRRNILIGSRTELPLSGRSRVGAAPRKKR